MAAIEGLAKKPKLADANIPDDFTNDLWLSTNFQVLNVGETYTLTSRRVPEITVHPPYTYEIIEGDSISLQDTDESNMEIKAEKKGASVIEIGYKEIEANGHNYGAVSSVNKSYMVVDVVADKEEDNGITLDTDISIRSYDTIYYDKGDTVDYSFTVNATGNDTLQVTCNGNLIRGNGNHYTMPLENRSNIIGITASKGDLEEKLYYVIDARKMEIKIENLSRQGEEIAVDDEVQVSFRGITPPIYQLATIYNPTWYEPNGQWPAYGTTVNYHNDDLGDLVSYNYEQYKLAEYNAIKFTVTEEKTYRFTDGYIDSEWWGSALGSEKDLTGPGNPNLNAPQNRDNFSILPDFEIQVKEKEEQEVEVQGLEITQDDLEQSQYDTYYYLDHKNYVVDGQLVEFISETQISYGGNTVDLRNKKVTYTITTDNNNQMTTGAAVTIKFETLDIPTGQASDEWTEELKTIYDIDMESLSEVKSEDKDINTITFIIPGNANGEYLLTKGRIFEKTNHHNPELEDQVEGCFSRLPDITISVE